MSGYETTQSIAEAFGITRRSVQRWIARGAPAPPTTRGELEAWLATRRGAEPAAKLEAPVELEGDLPVAGGGGDDERKWSTTYRRAKALHAVLDLQVKRGELVKRDEVRDLFVARVTEVRGALLVLPRRIAARFAPKIRDKLRRELELAIREILTQYSRDDELLAAEAPVKPAKKKAKRRAKR